jgi:hypothetical protein
VNAQPQFIKCRFLEDDILLKGAVSRSGVVSYPRPDRSWSAADIGLPHFVAADLPETAATFAPAGATIWVPFVSDRCIAYMGGEGDLSTEKSEERRRHNK